MPTFSNDILFLSMTLGQIFLFCYFGDLLTDNFKKVNDMFYQWNWYFLPLDIKRLMPTILCAANYPDYLRGFGNISGTRERFKKVNTKMIFLKKIISFYGKRAKFLNDQMKKYAENYFIKLHISDYKYQLLIFYNVASVWRITTQINV